MSEERTEEQILSKEPVIVELGGEKYEIQPLPISKSRSWREKFAAQLEMVLARVNLKTDTSEDFATGLRTAFIELPQTIAELVFAYSPALPRKRIERTATDAELIEAFKAVMRLAFPFGDHLTLLSILGAADESITLGSVYELMLAEYGLDPVAINTRWTDELFLLMLEKLAERKSREAEALDPDRPKKVSDRKLFAAMGITPDVVQVK